MTYLIFHGENVFFFFIPLYGSRKTLDTGKYILSNAIIIPEIASNKSQN